ncbi:dolichyl-P-Man:Man(5)GlcNAc(2)-PP-dolichol alpha-1,3-mannosyltransferase, variant 2, partial [Dermatophagoides farinae]
MGPIRNKSSSSSSSSSSSINRHNNNNHMMMMGQSFISNIKHLANELQDFIQKKIFTFKIFHEQQCYPIVSLLLLLFEIFLNVIIIQRVRYTEIDWSTYMQQVECFLNGTRDYSQITGATGPIVYPAGHIYVYTLLYWLTDYGHNIYRAQYIFASLYLITLFIVFRLYRQYSMAPPYVLLFMCLTSYRVHSIYVLRLFNDTVAILLLYLSLLSFTSGHKWIRGSILYSLAVSIKMNILLFAPGLFLLYNEYLNTWNVIKNLMICALVQIILAVPFIVTYPISYIKNSFNLGRIFLHKWTVNYRFMSEQIFIHKGFHSILLILHITILFIIFHQRWMNLIKKKIFSFNKNNFDNNEMNEQQQQQRRQQQQKQRQNFHHHDQHPDNGTKQKFGQLWNIYPSTIWSSIILHLVHLTILYRLIRWSNIDIVVEMTTTKTMTTTTITTGTINNDDNKIK